MTLGQHKEEVKKLHKLEDELIKLIAMTGNNPLMDKFLDWQTQRNKCNENYLNIIIKELSK